MPEEQKTTTTPRPSGAVPAGGRADLEGMPFRFKMLSHVLLFGAAAALVFYGWLYFQTGQHWQFLAEGGFLGLGMVCVAIAYRQRRRLKFNQAGTWVLIGLMIAYGGAELLFSGLTPYLAGGGILLILVIGGMLLPRKWFTWLMASFGFLVFVLLVNYYEPLPRYDVSRSSLLSIFTISISVISAGVILVQIGYTFIAGTIRNRLFIAFISLVLVPVALIIGISTWMGLRSGEAQLKSQLRSVATLKQAEINTWLLGLRLELENRVRPDQGLARMQTLLRTPDQATPVLPGFQDSTDRQLVLFNLRQAIDLQREFGELFLLDLQGRIVLSTDPWQEGKIYRFAAFFREGLNGFYFQPPLYDPSLKKVSIIAALPVTDAEGEPLGVLAGRTGVTRLNEIMIEHTGLGETGETYLVGQNYILLTDSRSPEYVSGQAYVRSQGIRTAVNNATFGEALYPDYRGKPVIGVYNWLPDLRIVLMAEQDQAEAFAPIYQTLQLNGFLALGAVLLAGVFALVFTRSIANPVIGLAETAQRIAAGNLTLTAPVVRRDEIGSLATAFNRMTGQLRDLVGSLEERVALRTRRLELVATLSERLTGILDLDKLLVELVYQIQENFGYYHAHVYLLDELREKLVVAAGTGEAGAAMQASGHSILLEAPTSLVARAARTGEPIRVDNVREAPDWLPNPLLPDTFSELAVPITVGSERQVVGVLDVQQNEIAGLDEGDVNLLRSLANQIGVAIRNARLFQEVDNALAEARVAQQRYLQQSWSRVVQTRQGGEYHYQRSGAPELSQAAKTWLEEAAVAGEQMIVVDTPGQNEVEHPAIMAPIQLQAQVIGTIQLHDPEAAQVRHWSEQELALIQRVADQVAQVAENIRLFEETRERFGREQTIRQVSDRLRAATSLESLLETAARELGQRLGARHTVLELGIEPDSAGSPLRQIFSGHGYHHQPGESDNE